MSNVKLATSHEPLVLFSCKDPFAVKQLLDNQSIPYERVVGRYAGKMEYSFVVFPEAVLTVARHGHLDDQESVLYLEAPHSHGADADYRQAWFAYLSLAPEMYAGVWRRTVKPAPNEGYTYSDGVYYVIRENVSRQKAKRWISTLMDEMFKRIQGRKLKPV